MLTLAIALAGAALATAPAGPIATATRGLVAVVEEDGQADVRLRAVRTRGCRTEIVGASRRWTIDWRRPASVALEDTFVFIDAPPVRIAIVADAPRPDQARRLRALDAAMRGVAMRCWAHR